LSAALVVLGCVVAIAACGSNNSSRNAASNGYTQALKFSACMRSHGVPNFPDPGAGGYQRSGVNFGSPATRSAMNACEKYLPPASGHEQPISASERQNELALADCMRANGVPDFPDPGPYGIQIPIGSGPNPQSPGFQTAQKVCKLPEPKRR
jgi:hypothetical protein